MPDDFVPEEFRDYTLEDESDDNNPIVVPTEVNEEFDMSDLGELAPTAKLEEGAFSFVDTGKHYLRIKSVLYANNGTESVTIYYIKNQDGTVEAVSCFSKTVTVTFCVPNVPNRTVRDTFQMPPLDRSQIVGYLHGFKDQEKALEGDDTSMGCGFWAKKLKQFVARVGFETSDSGKIDPRAFNPANWVGRIVGCEVEKRSQRYIDKKTKLWVEKSAAEAWPNVKMLSYFPYVPKTQPVTPVASQPVKEEAAPEAPPEQIKPTTKKVKQKA